MDNLQMQYQPAKNTTIKIPLPKWKTYSSPEHISEGGLSMDDVIYFADLHRMSIVLI